MQSLFFHRQFSSVNSKYKVAVLGAAGGIGQPLSLLLKTMPETYPFINHLALYDISNMGMSVDLGHIPTPVRVTGHSGKESLKEALIDSQVVIIPAGVPRKPGMTRDDLFNVNASIVKELAQACSQHCPKAHLLIISNPVNSTVPIAYQVLKNAGISHPNVIGITTLDVIRAQTFLGDISQNIKDPLSIKINVIGGHSGPTIVPLFSTSEPKTTFKDDSERTAILKRVQYGGDEVVQAKNGGGSATLSMAFAANIFTQKFLSALNGEKNIVTNAFIYNDQFKDKFMAVPVELGSNGIEKVLPLPKMDANEQALFEIANKTLAGDIQKGIDFVSKN